MNYLAHLYLSGSSDQIIVGNFIADFLKGKEAKSKNGEILKGVLLHREIDAFTDSHQQFANSKKKLWQRHRHYSSVIVDIFYDHFLARNWHEYSDLSLEKFAHHSYTTIQRFNSLLPIRAKQTLPHMIADNWLVNYREIEGVTRALQGLARRATFLSDMAEASQDLINEYDGFEKDFSTFFPQVISHSQACLKVLGKGSRT